MLFLAENKPQLQVRPACQAPPNLSESQARKPFFERRDAWRVREGAWMQSRQTSPVDSSNQTASATCSKKLTKRATQYFW